MSGWGRTEKFLKSHVDHDGDECLLWPFGRDGNGYARANVPGFSTRLAHRIMCEMVHGPSPFDGAIARHLCGRGGDGCVNQRHLAWGTPAQNYADMVAHGNNAIGEKIGRSVLTVGSVVAIRELHTQGSTQRDIAEKMGVHHTTIQAVIERRTWRHVA